MTSVAPLVSHLAVRGLVAVALLSGCASQYAVVSPRAYELAGVPTDDLPGSVRDELQRPLDRADLEAMLDPLRASLAPYEDALNSLDNVKHSFTDLSGELSADKFEYRDEVRSRAEDIDSALGALRKRTLDLRTKAASVKQAMASGQVEDSDFEALENQAEAAGLVAPLTIEEAPKVDSGTEALNELIRRCDALLGDLEASARDAQRLARAADRESTPMVLEQGTFFETVPAVAFDAQLQPTAIPAVAVGYRPKFSDDSSKGWGALNGLGFEVLLGGAFSSAGGAGDSSSGVELAVGGGVSYPIAKSASIAVGYVRWRGTNGIEDGLYIGLSFGKRPIPQAPVVK